MRLRWWWAAALLALFAAALGRDYWYLTFGGHRHYPDLPELVCQITGIGFSFCALLFLISLLPPYLKGWRRGVWCALAAAVLTAWGAYEAMRIPAAKSHEIAVEGLPPAFDGLRVVQISDIHCSPASRRDYVQGVVNRVNSLNPDIVCITGDLVDGEPKFREGDMAPLAELKARYGVYGCMGNHECYSGYHLWRPIFAGMGINMLDNTCVVITNGNDRLALGGVLDKTSLSYYQDGKRGGKPRDKDGRLRKRWPGPDVKAAFSNAPNDVCRILMQHRPADLAHNAKNGVKLQLSGHTHGAPVWGAGWLIGQMNEGHSEGLYQEHGLTLFVTPGAGQWVGFPLRMGVPSEVSELILRRRQ